MKVQEKEIIRKQLAISCLKYCFRDFADIVGFAHGIKVKYRHAEFYQFFRLLNSPFHTYLPHLLVIGTFFNFKHKFLRNINRKSSRKR